MVSSFHCNVLVESIDHASDARDALDGQWNFTDIFPCARIEDEQTTSRSTSKIDRRTIRKLQSLAVS
jgi:hypothetical protein